MQVKHLLLIAMLALTVACSSSPDKETVDENLSESQLYQQAQKELNNKDYNNAIKTLKALESRYPFGQYADQAQLDLIYANFKNAEPEAARAAAERFIRLHPQHPNVDYAYYIRGMSSFDQDRGLLARFLPLDMSKRDPGAARDSFNEFAQLTSRFPNSPYAPDAKARMIYLRNLLAAYEIHAGHYYLKRHAYVAAANRGRYVLENFQETPSVGDGLAIMVEAYRNLGLDDLADTALQTLEMNYPNNSSFKNGQFVYRERPEDERSWMARATLGLIDGRKSKEPSSETQAMRDVLRQYDDAKQQIPAELKPNHQYDEERQRSNEALDEQPDRSWWSYLTFGLFD